MNPKAQPKPKEKLSKAQERRKSKEILSKKKREAKAEICEELTRKELELFSKNVATRKDPIAISEDGKSILCLCQDRHEIKRDKWGWKRLKCDTLEIDVKAKTKKKVITLFIRESVKIIKLNNPEEFEGAKNEV